MKKIFYLISVSVFLFCGCSTPSGKENIKKSNIDKTSDDIEKNVDTYFPFCENKTYIYKTIDLNSKNTVEMTEVFPLFIRDDKAQYVIRRTKIFNGSEEVLTPDIAVYQKTGGFLKFFPISEQTTPFEDFTEKVLDGTEHIVFAEPLDVGMFFAPDDAEEKPMITSMTSNVVTPYAIFDNVMEITSNVYKDFEQKKYYAPNIGFVKELVFWPSYWEDSKPRTFSEELSQIISNSTFDTEQIVYVIDADNKKLSDKKFTLKLSTNDDINNKILDVLKENDLLKPTAKLNKFEITHSEYQTINLDFNDKFIDSTLESSLEKLKLQAIANTFGHIYDSDRVVITVGGKNYKSKNIAFKNGDYFDVE